MERKEKEIKDSAEIAAVIRKADICRLALSVDNRPYIVPLNFGFDGDCLYFHTAQAGKKIDMIRQNAAVCFELEAGCGLVRAETPCDWSMTYQSVVGYGTASLLKGAEEKRRALDVIMEHYSGRPGQYPDRLVDRLAIIRVTIQSMTGKRSGN
ncbi:MAG: pyridoxamine 5'-phosphate oxidase family protein [Deltaproteobacteria bacterium]|nr:pyridoxamine 5'-phosphate oxidase family protein [Deltaproteobacteria bacterium]